MNPTKNVITICFQIIDGKLSKDSLNKIANATQTESEETINLIFESCGNVTNPDRCELAVDIDTCIFKLFASCKK